EKVCIRRSSAQGDVHVAEVRIGACDEAARSLDSYPLERLIVRGVLPDMEIAGCGCSRDSLLVVIHHDEGNPRAHELQCDFAADASETGDYEMVHELGDALFHAA